MQSDRHCSRFPKMASSFTTSTLILEDIITKVYPVHFIIRNFLR